MIENIYPDAIRKGDMIDRNGNGTFREVKSVRRNKRVTGDIFKVTYVGESVSFGDNWDQIGDYEKVARETVTPAEQVAEMTDEALLAFAETHWTNHQQIIRGKSNKAADASWATYDAIRAEKHTRGL